MRTNFRKTCKNFEILLKIIFFSCSLFNFNLNWVYFYGFLISITFVFWITKMFLKFTEFYLFLIVFFSHLIIAELRYVENQETLQCDHYMDSDNHLRCLHTESYKFTNSTLDSILNHLYNLRFNLALNNLLYRNVSASASDISNELSKHKSSLKKHNDFEKNLSSREKVFGVMVDEF